MACQSQFKGIGQFKISKPFQSSQVKKPSSAHHSPLFPLGKPVDRLDMSRGFFKKKRKKHLGLDIRGDLNTPIKASHFGRVVYAGTKMSGYGKMILLEFDNNWATLYAHMNKLKVKTGDFVKRGQVIGLMGRTGRSTGVHLHFELIRNKQPIDPLPFLEQKIFFSRRHDDFKKSL